MLIHDTDAAVAVIKIGGSVLTGMPAYRRVAAFVAERLRDRAGEKLVLVVSAEEGTTDAVLEAARQLVETPDPATLDLLWSTGEIRSAALLTLCLHAMGIRAAALNVHQAGLVEDERDRGPGRGRVRSDGGAARRRPWRGAVRAAQGCARLFLGGPAPRSGRAAPARH